MPLGTNLLDTLIGSVVDPLRAALYPVLGNKQYNVHLVRRSWDGGARGLGTATITSDVTISPPPTVTYPNTEQAVHYAPDPWGRDEEGIAVLSEVSLQFSEAALTGGTIAPTDEFYVRVVDAQGQQIAPRYYLLDGPPIPDREKTMGWLVPLKRASGITE